MEEVKVLEPLTWKSIWKVEKYHGNLPREIDRYDIRPYEVIEGEGNLLLNEGINELFTILCSATGTKYDNTNARIGVGNSNAAENATQTALQGGSTALVGMDGGYPTFGTLQKVIFRATFDGSTGNFAWAEWTIDNGAAATKNLNRKVTDLGTKASGTTWIFTVEVSLS